MRYLLFCLVLLLTSTAQSQQFSEPIRINQSDSGKMELAPRIHSRGSMTYASWLQVKTFSSGDIYFARSTDGGETFSTAQPLTTTGKINGSLQRSAEFVVDPLGNIHMVWMENRIDNNPDVFYTRSTDKGTTWSTITDISRDGQKATQDFPSIAADSLGNIYVAWIDNREITGGISQNDHIYLTRSFDNGQTWDTPKRAPKNPGGVGGSCECCRTSIAASADGDLYIAYRTNMQHIRDIFIARSNDRGETFDESIRAQTKEWLLHMCPATGPMLALDKRENLHIVYRSAAYGDRPAVFYNVLPRGGDSTFTETALTPLGSGANYADVEVTDNGTIYVAYQIASKIRYRTSTDGGNTWDAERALAESEAQQEFVIFNIDQNGRILAAWEDDRRDKNDIMLASVTDTRATALPVLGMLTFQEGVDSVLYKWTLASPTDARLVWYYVIVGQDTFMQTADSIRIESGVAGRTAVTVIPVTSVGQGAGITQAKLAVASNARDHQAIVIGHPVRVGQPVMVDLDHEADLTWEVTDTQGKFVGVYPSSLFGSHHGILAFNLDRGVYHFHCNELGQGLMVVIGGE